MRWRVALAAASLCCAVGGVRAANPLPPRSPVNLPGGPYGNSVCYPTGIYYPGVGWTGGFQCFPNKKVTTPDCGCSSNPGWYPAYGYGGGVAIVSGIYGYGDSPVSYPPPAATVTLARSEAPEPPPPPPAHFVNVPNVAAHGNRAFIDVQVPRDAELWIQGIRMQQTGATRRFTSPELDPARTFTYDIKASWRENGREMTASRQLSVRAGDQVSITLLSGN